MTPNTVVARIKDNPWSWLWDYRIQVEFFRLLPRLWDAIEDEERKALVELIISGPPRDRFREDISPEDWERLRNRSIWERLARLASASTPLPQDASVRLADLERQYPAWKLTGADRENFPVWSESGTGYESDMSADELSQLPPAELVEKLLSGDYYRDGRLSVWEGLVMCEPMRAFPLLRFAVESQNVDEEVLASTFQALAEVAEPDLEVIDEITWIAAKIPHERWGRGIYPYARTVERLVVGAAPGMSEAALKLWDLAFHCCWEVSGVEGNDLLNKAINHPAGHLMEGLLARLRMELHAGERRLPDDYRERLEQALNLAIDLVGHGGIAARILICSRLSWLYWLDAAWTTKHVIPLFDWQSPEEARGAWQGFMWAPHLSPDIWNVLRPHLLHAFDHYADLHRASIVELLVHAYVARFQLSDEEVRDSLRKVDEAGVNTAAHTMAELLKGAGNRSSELWSDRIGPFFEHAWPREVEFKKPQMTMYITMAAIRSGEAFREAVDVVVPLLEPMRDPYMVIRELAATQQPENFPHKTLELLGAVVADSAMLKQSDLSSILQRVEAQGINLDVSAVGRRLRDAAARG